MDEDKEAKLKKYREDKATELKTYREDKEAKLNKYREDKAARLKKANEGIAGFKGGGKLGIDNAGQKLVQKLYQPLDPSGFAPVKPRPNQRLSGKGQGRYKGKPKQFKIKIT